jgi:hypothetical protein
VSGGDDDSLDAGCYELKKHCEHYESDEECINDNSMNKILSILY